MDIFMEQLIHHIDQLEHKIPVKIGMLSNENSIMVKSVQGSTVLNQYMNGTKDVSMPFEIQVKTANQAEGFTVLSQIMSSLTKLTTSESNETNAEILNVNAEILPVFDKEEEGYFYYKSQLVVDLTITENKNK